MKKFDSVTLLICQFIQFSHLKPAHIEDYPTIYTTNLICRRVQISFSFLFVFWSSLVVFISPFLSWVEITRQKIKLIFIFLFSHLSISLSYQCHSYDLIHLICSSCVLSWCIFNIEIIFDIGEISTLFCLHCINLKQKCQLLVQKLNLEPIFFVFIL